MNDDALTLAWGAASDRGLRRQLNEDGYFAGGGAFFVADGMGGHAAGEVASATALDALRPLSEIERVEPHNVEALLELAQDRVRAIDTSGLGRGAGTTLTGAVVAYIDAGTLTAEEARNHPRRHVITRALGGRDEARADFRYIPIGAHDRILVCSDGLTGELTDARITQIMLDHPDPQVAAGRLVEAAIGEGGRDNITVIVVDATGIAHETAGTSTSPRGGFADEDTLPRD